jgi:two-component system cell cycle sensor histidine kinase/response regulator CckA
VATPPPRAQAGRASRERFLEGLFLGSPVPILLLDVRTRTITRANAALAELVGWSARELTGAPLTTLDPAESVNVEEHLLLALACRDHSPRRYLWRSRRGDQVPVEIQAGRLHGRHGTLIALYVRDAREEHQAEQERRRLQSLLILAQKHEAVGRLAAGLAHNFSDLLSTVVLTAEALQGDPASLEKLDAGLGSILGAGRRARRLVGELMAFSGQQELRQRKVDLNEAVMGVQDLLQKTLSEGVELIFHLGEGDLTVNVDPLHLGQALVYLVENACDAMPDGGYVMVATQEVELDADFAASHPSVSPGPHVMLTVTDTGAGMDEEAQAHVFEPFFSTRDRGNGTGLGLATVYGIVKQSGGTIWVTSQPDMGTTFRIYLPCIAVEA